MWSGNQAAVDPFRVPGLIGVPRGVMDDDRPGESGGVNSLAREWQFADGTCAAPVIDGPKKTLIPHSSRSVIRMNPVPSRISGSGRRPRTRQPTKSRKIIRFHSALSLGFNAHRGMSARILSITRMFRTVSSRSNSGFRLLSRAPEKSSTSST